MARSFFHQAAYLMLVLSLITGSDCQTSTITIDGIATAVYSSTPVGTNPQGIPTLLYNCAKLPAICNNVNSAYPLSPAVVGTATYRSIPTASQGYYEFNLDKDTVRKNRRRRLSCPANWKSSHACPERDQPLVVGAGKSVSDGFVGSLLEPGISYQIADQEGVSSGMDWTCDEFPAATFLKVTPNPTGIYTFHFATIFDDRDATWATAVTWYDANGEKDQNAYRRSLSSSTAFKALDHGLPGGPSDVGALGDMAALEQAGYHRLVYRYSGDGRPDFQLRYRYQSDWISDDSSSAVLSSRALVVPRSNSHTVNSTDQTIDDCSSTVALDTAKDSKSDIYPPFPSDSVLPTMYQWTQQGTGSASSRANRTTSVNTITTDNLGSTDAPHSMSYTESPQPSTTITYGMSISGGSGILTSGRTISTSNIDVSIPTLTSSFESSSLSSVPAPSSPGLTSSRISGVSGTASQPSLDTSAGVNPIDSTSPASGSLSETTLLPLSTATSNGAQTATLSGVDSPTYRVEHQNQRGQHCFFKLRSD
ncbi:hypothetical protein LTR17_003789 [Elasticomyces elasticus]|nr:hypothetical protein LTR17_003789 [Elasticomyces elasticus]